MTPDVLLSAANLWSVFVLGAFAGFGVAKWALAGKRCARCQ